MAKKSTAKKTSAVGHWVVIGWVDAPPTYGILLKRNLVWFPKPPKGLRDNPLELDSPAQVLYWGYKATLTGNQDYDIEDWVREHRSFRMKKGGRW